MACFLNLSKFPHLFEELGNVKWKYKDYAWGKLNKIFSHFPESFRNIDETFEHPFCYYDKNEISIFEKYYCLRNQIYKNYMCQKYSIPIETKGLFYYYQYIGPKLPDKRQYLLLLQKRTILWKKKLDMPFQEFYYDN